VPQTAAQKPCATPCDDQNPGRKFADNRHPRAGLPIGCAASNSKINPPALTRTPAPTLRNSVCTLADAGVDVQNAPVSEKISPSSGSRP
jgi:hypothetical protein